MSTSLRYHAFGLRGYHYARSEFQDGRIHFHITQPRERLVCPTCQSTHVWQQGSVSRQFRTVPIGLKPVIVHFDVPRVLCFLCATTRQVHLAFAAPRKSYTRSFERYVLDLCPHMTLQAVARHLQVGWDIVKDIQASSLQKRFHRPKLSKRKRIAIDEIHIGHGNQYLTIVLDLMSGAVVFVGDGKDSKALTHFWRALKNSRARREAVATDMSPAFTKSVRENAPQAVHVSDRFHVVKLFNEKLSQLRREVHRNASSAKKKVLEGTRWLLLKNPENLDEGRNEKPRLQEALDLNTPLTLGYYLKEDLRQIWEQANKRTARKVLRDWIARARATEGRILVPMADTIESHAEGILAWYDCRISTGPLEGVNNKIKTMNRQAYGYRDREFFKLKILGLHETQYALVG